MKSSHFLTTMVILFLLAILAEKPSLFFKESWTKNKTIVQSVDVYDDSTAQKPNEKNTISIFKTINATNFTK